MNKDYTSAVKLLRTNKYNTYQFFGYMANPATKPGDGLKIAALSCLSWLRKRLEGNRIPECLLMPEENQYDNVKDEDFKSFNITDEYIIDVVSDIEDGIWALRIIENDLGALGSGEAVPGRTIESNIAFRIVDNRLQCAFKTSISDKEDVEKAGCIRFSLIKELCFNPLFGLKQIEKIYDPENMDINNEEKLNDVAELYRNKDNQLPLIIYTYDDFSESNNIATPTKSIQSSLFELQKESIKKNTLSKAEPYAARYAGYARPYFLPKRMFDKFKSSLPSGSFSAGDVIVVDPKKYGGNIRIYSYEDKNTYRDHVGNFSRDKNIDFGDVVFVDEAKILIDQKNEDYKSDILAQLDETTRSLENIKSKINRTERINEYKKSDNDDVSKELEETLEKLKKSENTVIVLNRELDRLKSRLTKMEEYVSFVNRKASRPSKHNEIADWISSYKYVVFDKKAVDCLNRNDAENVDIGIICDSLDYLEYVYSQYLFEGMDKEELNNKSSEIYNRPFIVSPSGIPVSAKGECKIKYTFEDGIRREYPLDMHLKVGNHGELIRIYFIIDKNNKKIVIGSLPNHLIY